MIPGEKVVLAVGSIRRMDDIRVKATQWVDEFGVAWLEVENLTPMTSDEAWSALDGEVLS